MTQAATAIAKPVNYVPQPNSKLLTKLSNDSFAKVIMFMGARALPMASVCKQLNHLIKEQAHWYETAVDLGIKAQREQLILWKDCVERMNRPAFAVLSNQKASSTLPFSGHAVRDGKALLCCHEPGKLLQTQEGAAPIVYEMGTTAIGQPYVPQSRKHLDCLALSEKYVVCTQLYVRQSMCNRQMSMSLHGEFCEEFLHVWKNGQPTEPVFKSQSVRMGPTNCIKIKGDHLYLGGHSWIDGSKFQNGKAATFGLHCLDLKNQMLFYPHLNVTAPAKFAFEELSKEFVSTAILNMDFLGSSTMLTLHQDLVMQQDLGVYRYRVRLWDIQEKVAGKDIRFVSTTEPKTKLLVEKPMPYLETPSTLISFHEFPESQCTQMCTLNGFLFTASHVPFKPGAKDQSASYVALRKIDIQSRKCLKKVSLKADMQISAMTVVEGLLYTGSTKGILRIWNDRLNLIRKTEFPRHPQNFPRSVHYIGGTFEHLTIGTSTPIMPDSSEFNFDSLTPRQRSLVENPYRFWFSQFGLFAPNDQMPEATMVYNWNCLPPKKEVPAAAAAAGAGAGRTDAKDSKKN